MITSKKNSRLQNIRLLLQDRKNRDAAGQFVIEGVRLVEEAAGRHASIQEAFFTPSLSERGKQLVAQLQRLDVPLEEVEEGVFNSLMDTATSQGIAAVCQRIDPYLPDDLDFVIIADQLRDPGNLGTVLRTAAASGAQAVFTTPGSVDLYSPKVVRSAMGAHFHILCAEMDWHQLQDLKARSTRRYNSCVAVVGAEKVYWTCDFTLPTILIIGSEADGASVEACHFADQQIAIPMPGDFESLNAAVAAGILIFEVIRQRS